MSGSRASTVVAKHSAPRIDQRAAKHAALGDPVRLALIDELAVSDRSPIELRQLLDLESNLLAHHLDVLESVGMIVRSRSSGDGRRRYVHLIPGAFDGLTPGRPMAVGRALFICTHNSARSQLAAALWRSITNSPAESAGTEPAAVVHPKAVDAARRAGMDLTRAVPRAIDDIAEIPAIVITVCDQAHEAIDADPSWLHWSVPDPVVDGTRRAFDDTVVELRHRISALVGTPGTAA
jgi:protein-tyrosine-phosphatase/DNA-binding transcriptional ArsR family regulator